MSGAQMRMIVNDLLPFGRHTPMSRCGETRHRRRRHARLRPLDVNVHTRAVGLRHEAAAAATTAVGRRSCQWIGRTGQTRRRRVLLVEDDKAACGAKKLLAWALAGSGEAFNMTGKELFDGMLHVEIQIHLHMKSDTHGSHGRGTITR